MKPLQISSSLLPILHPSTHIVTHLFFFFWLLLGRPSSNWLRRFKSDLDQIRHDFLKENKRRMTESNF